MIYPGLAPWAIEFRPFGAEENLRLCSVILCWLHGGLPVEELDDGGGTHGASSKGVNMSELWNRFERDIA